MDTLEGSTERLVIIGAGPAGLASAAGAATVRPLVIEAGTAAEERSQDDPISIVEGVGGAGLYSDGKFSFFPSATRLWELDERLLVAAYAWYSDMVRPHGVNAPPLPSRDRAAAKRTDASDAAIGVVRTDKRYESQYCPPAQRARLVDALAAGVRIATGTQVVGLRRDEGGWAVHLRADGRDVELRCDAVVVTAGRFGPLLTAGAVPAPSHRPLRLEVGVRIEQPADTFFLRHDDRVDPKISWENADMGVGWRTFCCCREGLVATTRTHGMLTVSGRADCDATGRSNVGFNVRLTAPDDIAQEWPPLRDRLTAAPAATSVPLAALLPGAAPDIAANALRRILGEALSARLAEGLARLVTDFPRAGLEEARVTGPTLEGIGMYPQHNARLATNAPGLWVAGDCAGTFRGLTAALVSGHAAGRAAAEASR